MCICVYVYMCICVYVYMCMCGLCVYVYMIQDSKFNIIFSLTIIELYNYNESYRGIPKSHQGNLMIGDLE